MIYTVFQTLSMHGTLSKEKNLWIKTPVFYKKAVHSISDNLQQGGSRLPLSGAHIIVCTFFVGLTQYTTFMLRKRKQLINSITNNFKP